jgi:hypothetical protein
MTRPPFTRLVSMDPEEAAFRLSGELRKWRERALMTVSKPRWNRAYLLAQMRELPAAPHWNRAYAAVRRQDYAVAQDALADHFAERESAFPLDAREVERRAATIAAAFPRAAEDARRRADAIAAGSYDLLGHEGVHVGTTVDWHADAVHGRRAPVVHWASVPYLNPVFGDHKVIWELNRHQHWLTLGRAFALTGERAYYDIFRTQTRDWMIANPPLTGINWASMLELGFRTLSWLWALTFFAGAAKGHADREEPWLVDLLLGIAAQIAHIQRNLSLYFSPNTHLTGEALALYVAGCALPEFVASDRWAATGREVLLREAGRQIRSDGGHAELSGHYHRYSTDFYLLALVVAERSHDPNAAAFEDAARRQARFLRVMADDAGRRPSIGDDDGGQLFPICGRAAEDCTDTLAVAATLLRAPGLAVGAPAEEAFWLCGDRAAPVASPASGSVRQQRAAFGEGCAVPSSTALPASGYYVSRRGDGDHLIFDAGPHGYLNGGHAHADALSVVLTVAGRRLLIDPGTATYTLDGDLRDRFRDSAMHNTLVLDGRPQSQPDGPFHWRSRASARAALWCSSRARAAGCDYVEGTHDGYLPVVPVRSVLAIHGVGWWILDHILGIGTHESAIYWHLHPAWRPALEEACVRLRHEDGAELALACSTPPEIVQPGESPFAAWSPAYGRVEPAPILRVRARIRLPQTFATFIPATNGLCAGLRIEPLAIDDVPDGRHATGWRASWTGGAACVLAAVEADGPPRDLPIRPASSWGSDALRTDARLAATVERNGHVEAALVNGRTLSVRGTTLITLQTAVDIVRTAPPGKLASSMHEQGSAEVGIH